MKVMLATVALVISAGFLAAEDKKEANKIDAAKLVGQLELVKGGEQIPKGAIVEFAKDGKLKASFSIEGMKIELTGSYKVDGDKLKVTLKLPDGKEEEDTDTIKSVSDDKLELIGKDKSESEWKKLKK